MAQHWHEQHRGKVRAGRGGRGAKEAGRGGRGAEGDGAKSPDALKPTLGATGEQVRGP